jgi:hypothetical protein
VEPGRLDRKRIGHFVTGAIACGQYLFTAPLIIQLHDQTIHKITFGSATASYQLTNSGTVKNQDGTTLESWLLSGSASAYEVNATLVSGALTTGTTGSWLNLGTTQTWSIINSARDNSVKTASLTVQIRDVATQTVQASANITLSAESDNFN